MQADLSLYGTLAVVVGNDVPRLNYIKRNVWRKVIILNAKSEMPN